MIVTGIPIPDTAAAYYEAAATDDVEDVLNTLGIIVLGVGAAATLLSAALGSWASRRALTPLGEVRLAAESLAAGELDTRLDPPADADLASLTASFNGMARSLEDRIERDARFAPEVSHELRSPLMTLNASVEVLNNNRDSMTERNQTALDLLTDDVTRFTALVEDLLEISRYDVGTASLRAEPIDLVEFVRQSVDHSPTTSSSTSGHSIISLSQATSVASHRSWPIWSTTPQSTAPVRSAWLSGTKTTSRSSPWRTKARVCPKPSGA